VTKEIEQKEIETRIVGKMGACLLDTRVRHSVAEILEFLRTDEVLPMRGLVRKGLDSADVIAPSLLLEEGETPDSYRDLQATSLALMRLYVPEQIWPTLVLTDQSESVPTQTSDPGSLF
jgi:hypothetical protein